MPVVVDASVWIDYFAGRLTPQTQWLDEALGKEPLAVTDLGVGEVLRGLASESDQRKAREALLRFTVYNAAGLDMVLKSAEHHRALHAQGETAPGLAASLVAAFCLRWNLPLLHSDPAYEPYERHLGLKGSGAGELPGG
ncbi:MAG: PIN domain-containing protein [Acidobacteriota bacterium]